MKSKQPAGELLAALASGIWAIQPEHMRSMIASAASILSGTTQIDAEGVEKFHSEIQAARRQQISASTGGSVVVLPIYGVITQKYGWYCGTAVEGFTMQFRAALNDPNVTAIVLDVDSPGGSVSGVDELAAEIFAARSKKTVIAISNTLNASAAYYLSSQASELYVMPSSLTGSIGVYNGHEDISGYLEAMGVKITLVSAGRYKVDGNSYEPLSDDARAAMQKLVDGYYDAFVKAVARGRKVKPAAVKDGFGEGRVLMADEAVSSGMADKVGTLDMVLARFGVQRTGTSEPYAEAVIPAPVAEAAVEAPVAAKKADTDDSDATPDDNDDDGIECKCECTACSEDDDCGACTVDDCDADGCQCKAMKDKAKAQAAHDLKLAFEREQISVRLAL